MMLSITDFQGIIANSFFDGSTTIAGLVMFSVVLLLLFVLVKDKATVIIIAMPVTLIFGTLGILSLDMVILLIIVSVLALAMVAKNKM